MLWLLVAGLMLLLLFTPIGFWRLDTAADDLEGASSERSSNKTVKV